jgi:FkbM family methyltransferase
MRTIDTYIDFVISKILEILPEGKFKENLRKIFFRYHNNLYALNKLIRKIELSDNVNGEILVELTNGLKLFGIHNKVLPGAYGINRQDYEFKYGNPKKLDKIGEINLDYFGDFLSILKTMFTKNIYQRYYHLKEGDVVVDCGANIGMFTVKAAKIVGEKGKIIAVEPEERNLKCLKKNIEINGLKNCVVVSKGVWSEKSRMKFFLGPASGWHSLIEESWFREKYTSLEKTFAEIEVDTLNNILKELEIDKVDFIKMDIEGAEIEALKGMEETLRNNDVKLAIEAFHVVDCKPTSETIIPLLKGIGFKIQEEGGFVYAEK